MVQNIPPALLAKAPSVQPDNEPKHIEVEHGAAVVSEFVIPTVHVQEPTSTSAPMAAVAEEKWEENDYVVNVLYDRWVYYQSSTR
jgi:hypothetical protein